MTVASTHLAAPVRTAATTTAHWQRFFDALVRFCQSALYLLRTPTLR